ncbi:MAG: hypothetical protein KAR42_18155, partial [candidate division Zixibacteria bacterium]|nr:hypothetical protein [candidate division Zixibacteria bacterium]
DFGKALIRQPNIKNIEVIRLELAYFEAPEGGFDWEINLVNPYKNITKLINVGHCSFMSKAIAQDLIERIVGNFDT